ncbi:stage II sporulation protein M [Paenibacillus albiflavus]|uniref:Stage II sporulation protein M n=1 Tax=Paenibacillus albiflavus TaxID=2545760 RepID=A0A4R4ECR9_9BACL|nr:stage II sporulation protein M [Paenibacillus albiflavus]TCZ77489.1 stage II sporulation protein M [Paenibacillus albiflavus]
MARRFSIRKYLQDYSSLYVFIAVLFVMGVAFGAVMVNALSLDQKQEMLQQLGAFFYSLTDHNDFSGQSSFIDSLWLNLKWILLIWLLGLSVIGLPLIFVLDFLKGVLIGFTVGYLVGQFSWEGVLFSLVSVAPQNLLIIPLILIASVTAASFSIAMVKSQFMRGNYKQGQMVQALMRTIVITLGVCVIIVGVSAYEGYISPYLMQWVTPTVPSI